MRIRVTAISLALLLLLVGCGASFSVTPADFEQYANSEKCTYVEITEEDTERYSLKSVVAIDDIITLDGSCRIELWTFEDGADKWFTETVAALKEESKYYSGSTTVHSGDYKFTGEDNYRILFCDNLGIKAKGNGYSIEEVLKELDVI